MKRNKYIVFLGDKSRYLTIEDINIESQFDSIKSQLEYFKKNIDNKEEGITQHDIDYPSAMECFEHDILDHIIKGLEYDKLIIRYKNFCEEVGLVTTYKGN